MPREYFLSPASKNHNDAPFRRLKETVVDGLSRNNLSQYTEAALTSPVRVWGYRDGSRPTWQKMDPGDVILFYTGDGYRYAARIRAKERNDELSKEVWGLLRQTLGGDVVGDFEPWPNLVYLQNLRRLALPSEYLHELLGYQDDYITGVRRVKQSRLRLVRQKYGSMGALVVKFTKEKMY